MTADEKKKDQEKTDKIKDFLAKQFTEITIESQSQLEKLEVQKKALDTKTNEMLKDFEIQLERKDKEEKKKNEISFNAFVSNTVVK